MPAAAFWATTPHEYMAAFESNRRAGRTKKGGSALSADDVKRLQASMAAAKAAEARHREEQAGASDGAHAG